MNILRQLTCGHCRCAFVILLFAASSVLSASLVSAGDPVVAQPVAATPAAVKIADEESFRVESRELKDYRGTRLDVESNITDDLATKLRQFDEWTIDGEDRRATEVAQSAAASASASAAAATAAAGRAQAATTAAQRAAAAAEAAQQAKVAAEAADTAAAASAAAGGPQAAAEAARQAATSAAVASAAAASVASGVASGAHGSMTAGAPNALRSSGASGQPLATSIGSMPPHAATAEDSARSGVQQPPAAIRPDVREKEDDVAQMIREAAEQETDPERRKELLEQYDAYVDTL